MAKLNLHYIKFCCLCGRISEESSIMNCFYLERQCWILLKSINEFIRPAKAKIAVYWIRNKTRDFATRQCSYIDIHCKGTRYTIYTMEWEMILLHGMYSPNLGPVIIVFFRVCNCRESTSTRKNIFENVLMIS